MGSIFSAIWDDYQDYCRLCEKMNVSALSDRATKNFYDHWDELKKKQQKKTTGQQGP